jgi:predicted hydrocarbon binding protein
MSFEPPTEPILTTLPRATIHALTGLNARTSGERIHLLRQAGYEGGSAMASAFESSAGDDEDGSPGELPLEQFNSRVTEFFGGAGWGRLSMTSLHDLVAAVDVSDCWESRAHGAVATPSCHVTTGLLAAFFSRFAPYPLATLEVECASAGNSHCRFLLGQPEVLGELYRHLARGDDYSAALAQLSEVSASA